VVTPPCSIIQVSVKDRDGVRVRERVKEREKAT
jgi:hypothetical protein